MSEPMCIHVIDDDSAALESTGMLLRALGFEAVEWPSGSAFFAGCDLARIDCLLLDSRMPGMNGEVVVAELAARGIAAPVIIMSGHALREDGPLGHLTFLEKPFSVADLRQAIETARGAATAPPGTGQNPQG